MSERIISGARVLQGEFGVINGMGSVVEIVVEMLNQDLQIGRALRLYFSPSSLFHLDSVKSVRIPIP